jgi:hypothetical protein
MHDSSIVSDVASLETGSFNDSFSAKSRDAENFVAPWGSPDTGALFSKDFAEISSEPAII